MVTRLSDAWAWLVAHGLIGPSMINPAAGNYQAKTAGVAATKDSAALSKVWADECLSGDLDRVLSAARANFALGDYEVASFAAMKSLEVEVSRAASLSNDLVGVALMRKAFSPKDGILRHQKAEGGEQQATADLFAGVISAYRNPASHRTVRFDDLVEAAEVIRLADLLLRIVRRAEKRLQARI